MFSMVRETYHGEGVSGSIYPEFLIFQLRGFFKGLASPLVGITPITVGVFCTKDLMLYSLQGYNMSDNTKVAVSGAFASVIGTIIKQPVDLLKCRA